MSQAEFHVLEELMLHQEKAGATPAFSRYYKNRKIDLTTTLHYAIRTSFSSVKKQEEMACSCQKEDNSL
ncbi:MAG: hypothetical protein IJN29_13615 [Akkermansia sp.]|nr:hypothetical protein [Akkermansia sp.]